MRTELLAIRGKADFRQFRAQIGGQMDQGIGRIQSGPKDARFAATFGKRPQTAVSQRERFDSLRYGPANVEQRPHFVWLSGADKS